MKFSGVYRMSDDGVYLSSVPYFLSGYVEFEAARSISNFGVDLARCSIGVVRGVFQVGLIWFTGISNSLRISRLG